MAINLTDFDKIWASSSPLTPYSFSDANYEEGWNFVGSTPPARQMWDSYFKWSDEKQQYIVQNFLPLSGGTMTGAIQADSTLANFTYGYDYANREGASVDFFNATTPSDPGVFKLIADDSVNRSYFVGKPDGSLVWNAQNVALLTEIGYGYARISDGNGHGVQICWGRVQNATSAGVTATFDKAFPSGTTVRVIMSSVAGAYSCWSTDISETGFTAHSSTTGWTNYIAIGDF